MNRFRLRFPALITVLLMLCSCGLGGYGSSQPAQDNPADPMPDMLSAAELYEEACGGVDFDGTNYGVTAAYPYGWLKRHGLLESFAATDAQGEVVYTLPQPLAEALCALLFGVDISPDNTGYDLTYYPEYDNNAPLPFALTPPAQTPVPESDGSYTITFARSTGSGRQLRSVRYRFVPVQLTETPAMPIGGVYKKGDTVWRIASVSNMSQKTPEREAFETVFIRTTDDLQRMAAAINSGRIDAQQKRYLLENDLDMQGIPFSPIGSNRPLLPYDLRDDSPTGFCAVFDGQGHTISNLSIALYSPETPDMPLAAGFFAVIGEEGTVENLTLEHAAVSTPTTEMPAASAVMTGLLAGHCAGEVRNCHVSGSVLGSYQTGGLAGLIGNYNTGDEARYARVTACTADVAVAGDSEMGGFAGSLHGAFITDCRAQGEVMAVSGHLYGMPRAIGGFCGFSVAGSVNNCDASVFVKTQLTAEWVGAFMGYNQGSIINSRYNRDKSPYWQPVGVVYNDAPSAVESYSVNVKSAG